MGWRKLWMTDIFLICTVTVVSCESVPGSTHCKVQLCVVHMCQFCLRKPKNKQGRVNTIHLMYSFKHLFIRRQSCSVSCAWVWRAACSFLNHSILYKQENACMHRYTRAYKQCIDTHTCIQTWGLQQSVPSSTPANSICVPQLPSSLHQAVSHPHQQDFLPISNFKFS